MSSSSVAIARDEAQVRAGSLAELLRVSLPLVISAGSMSVMHFADRMFLAWHSADEMAASMPASLMNWSMISFAYGTANYTNTFVSQYYGARKYERVITSVWQGLYVALGFCLLYWLLLPFAPLLFSRMGHTPQMAEYELAYFSIMTGGAFFYLATTVLGSFFTGRGKTHIVMWVNCGGMAANILFNYILIFGKGPFPELGIRGAAIGTVSAYFVTSIIFVVVILKREDLTRYPVFTTCRFNPELAWRMVRFGFPTGIQLFVDVAGFALMAVLIGQIDSASLAATTMALNLNALSFVPMFGMGMALMILVGQRVGEKRPELAERTAYLSLRLTCLYMGTWIVGYLLFPRTMMLPYLAYMSPVDAEGLVATTSSLLRFVAIYGMFDALAVICGNAVRGAGDTKFPTWVMVSASLFVLMGPCLVVSVLGVGSLYVYWSIATAYIFTIGTAFFFRFRSGVWKSMQVIEHDADDVSVPTGVQDVLDAPAGHVGNLVAPVVDAEPDVDEALHAAV